MTAKFQAPTALSTDKIKKEGADGGVGGGGSGAHSFVHR